MKNAVSQTVEGVEYLNLCSIAEAYNLDKNRIYKRYSRGLRNDYLIPLKFRKSYRPVQEEAKQKLIIGNHEFENEADACRKQKVKYGSYRARLRYGWSVEEALNLVPRMDGRKKKRPNVVRRNRPKDPLVLFGKLFRSYEKLGEYVGIEGYVLWQRVNIQGLSLEEAVLADGKKKKIDVGCEEFESKAEFAKKANIDTQEIYSLLKRYTPKQLLEGVHRQPKSPICHKGTFYSNLTALASDYDLTYPQLKYRLDACEGDLNLALSIPKGISVVGSIFGKAAHFYVAEILDSSQVEGKKYKVGVTQYPLERRFNQFPFECSLVFCKNGDLDLLRNIEKNIKQRLEKNRVTDYAAEDFDGFTEVYRLDNRELSLVKFLAQFPECELEVEEGEMSLAA